MVTNPRTPGAIWLTRAALLLILAAGGWLRLTDAATAPLEGIEAHEFIPVALSLSLDHHPVRMAQHGAVPAYLIRLGGLVFGESDLGLRMMSVIAGTATIALLYLIAARWWGPPAGLVAATLLSVERYHAAVSARAIDLPFDLLFIAIAMYCFAAFLKAGEGQAQTERSGHWLYGAAVASALGFLCKELTALMLPVLLLSLILTRRTSWLRRPAPWLAAGVFLLVIAPDIYSSFTTTPTDRMNLLHRQLAAMEQRGIDLPDPARVADGYYMSHGDQLARFQSIAFNPEPFYFYFGDVLNSVGVPHVNNFDEFPFMHPVMAGLLWAGVAFAVIRRRKDSLIVFCLTMFVAMLFPFSLVELRAARGELPADPRMLWYWVDRTMLPAILLTGSAVAALLGRLRTGRLAVHPPP